MTSLTLRPYQLDNVEQLRGCYAQGAQAPLYQLATGGGKTVVFCDIVSSAATKGRRTAVLAHRRELIGQASEKLDWAGVPHGIVAAGQDRDHDAPVLVASIQTITARGPEALGKLDFIVADEAHHARAETWAALLRAHPKAKLLGVTATPARTDGMGLGRHCGGLFDALVCGPPTAKLVEDGYLAASQCFVPQRKIDVTGLRKVAGDWAGGEEMAARASVVTGDAVLEYHEKAAGKSAIAFCVTVAHAQTVAAAFALAGYRSACVHGKTPKPERDSLIRRLGDGSLDVLTSCDLISEGLDVPSVGAVILLRPTASLILCLQQIGRGMRPKADGSPLIVLDHAGNVDRHGAPEDEREWTLDGVTKKPRAVPVVEREVEMEPRGARVVGVEEGDLVLREPVPATWWAFISQPRTHEEAQRFAKARGYKRGWVIHFMREQAQRLAVVA